MMQYDFVDQTAEINAIHNLETKENMNVYSGQDDFLKPTVSNSNMITTSDIWSTSTNNSNSLNQSFYFPSSFDFNSTSTNHPSQYQTIDHPQPHYDYQTLPDVSSSYFIDPYSHMFTNNYSLDAYSTPTGYHSTSMDYPFSTTDTYSHLHPNVSSLDLPADYQSPPTTTSQWDSAMLPMPSHEIPSASNSSSTSTSASKQPCLVCHDESSGYHFGAYTCESCKAFYRRVTKDPCLEIKHSCEVPLPTITKSNRKDCRACRKAKCDRVGMTAMPRDRPSRATSNKTPPLPVTNLLEQLARDLTYDQLTNSSALENLLGILELPDRFPTHLDSHSLYMNAIRLWRNQYNHSSPMISNVALMDIFAVLLYLFHIFLTLTENDEDTSTNHSKFDKLVNILQQEIHRITGTDHRSACRIKALFMKSYVALAQCPTALDQSQFPSYSQYPLYGQ